MFEELPYPSREIVVYLLSKGPLQSSKWLIWKIPLELSGFKTGAIIKIRKKQWHVLWSSSLCRLETGGCFSLRLSWCRFGGMLLTPLEFHKYLLYRLIHYLFITLQALGINLVIVTTYTIMAQMMASKRNFNEILGSLCSERRQCNLSISTAA